MSKNEQIEALKNEIARMNLQLDEMARTIDKKTVEKTERTLLRYRFSYPAEDVDISAWMDAQTNISHSLRQLIKTFVKEHGVTDATCLSSMRKTPAKPIEVKQPVSMPDRKESCRKDCPLLKALEKLQVL